MCTCTFPENNGILCQIHQCLSVNIHLSILSYIGPPQVHVLGLHIYKSRIGWPIWLDIGYMLADIEYYIFPLFVYLDTFPVL